MLIYNSRLMNMPVMSLQTGGLIGIITGIIIDPDKLKIIAFILRGREVTRQANILDVKSIREYSSLGMIVDSADELVAKDDVIHIANMAKLDFSLIGLRVETKRKHRLGKVEDFTVTDDDFLIQQLIVKRPIVKSFLDSELIIPRSEIKEVTDEKVIVKSDEKKIKEKAENAEFIPNFVNPFRKTEPSHAPAETGSPAELDRQ